MGDMASLIATSKKLAISLHVGTVVPAPLVQALILIQVQQGVAVVVVEALLDAEGHLLGAVAPGQAAMNVAKQQSTVQLMQRIVRSAVAIGWTDWACQMLKPKNLKIRTKRQTRNLERRRMMR